jgi:hypothetical protein
MTNVAEFLHQSTVFRGYAVPNAPIAFFRFFVRDPRVRIGISILRVAAGSRRDAGASNVRRALPTDSRRCAKQTMRPIAEAKSSVSADWDSFCGWCMDRGFAALPATPDTVARYLRWLIDRPAIVVNETVVRPDGSIAVRPRLRKPVIKPPGHASLAVHRTPQAFCFQVRLPRCASRNSCQRKPIRISAIGWFAEGRASSNLLR